MRVPESYTIWIKEQFFILATARIRLPVDEDNPAAKTRQ
jgi:hypothetical protein